MHFSFNIPVTMQFQKFCRPAQMTHLHAHVICQIIVHVCIILFSSSYFFKQKFDGATHQSWGQHHQSLSGFVFPIEGRPQLTTFLAFFAFAETCFLLVFLSKYCPKF